MSAGSLARLQGASEVQTVEGSCSGAAKGMEDVAVPALHSSSGYPDGLALSSSPRNLPASVCCCETTTENMQRLPHQAEVRQLHPEL